MAEYYRSIFTIEDGRKGSLDLLTEIERHIEEWAIREFGEPERDGERLQWRGDAWNARFGRGRTEAAGLSRLFWERRGTEEGGVWRLSLRLASDGEQVEADVEVQGPEENGTGVDPQYAATTPPFLGSIVERFECAAYGMRLRLDAVPVRLEDSRSFIDEKLLDPDRRLPILVVSGERGIDSVERANSLQRRLLGLAQVFAFSHDVAWSIAKDLPRPLRCYDGAIRLYSPGCTSTDVSQQHPYWMADEATGLGDTFWPMLRDECVNRLSPRGRRRLFTTVRSQMREQENERLESRVRELEYASLDVDSDSWDDLLNMFLTEPLEDADSVSRGKFDALGKVARAMRNRARRREDELEALKNGEPAIAADDGEADDGSEHAGGAETGQDPALRTVVDAVNEAQRSLEHLRFLPDSFESAESTYTRNFDGRAGLIYEVFVKLERCAQERVKGSLGTTAALYLRNIGVTLSDEAQATKQEHLDVRLATDPQSGEELALTQHVKLFGNEFRIHLIWAQDEGRWLIGHVGEHLGTSSDPH